MQLSVHIESWELVEPFRIAGAEWRTSNAVVVEIVDGDFVGRGEGIGIFYTGETVDSIAAQVDSIADDIRNGLERSQLQSLLPVGGARNAIDCALWDLEAKRQGRSIWDLTGIRPKPVTTVYTIGLETTPQGMAAKAKQAANYPALKIKLSDDQPLERLRAIHAARPDARLVVDANQSWSFDVLQAVAPHCAELHVEMIEQPLPRGGDEILEEFNSPVLLAADESCLDTSELDIAARRYGMINIKLDKTGGLTEALLLAKEARKRGCQLMVGNMLGTSLSMAPSFVIAQLCDLADIDGPVYQKFDRPHAMTYQHEQVGVFKKELWG